MILAIDFDGVLHDFKHPLPGQRMGAPLPDAVWAMQQLDVDDHQLVIYTVRGQAEHVEQWLDHYDIPYNSVTDHKPNADCYIDDKAIRFTTWPDVLAEIGESGV